MTDRADADVARLRREFDEQFQRPAADGAAPPEHVLAIAYGSVKLAVLLRGAGALLRTPAMTPVPSSQASLLGIAGIGGRLTAVHDLGRVLGLEGGREGEALEWTVLCGPDADVALAFSAVEGYRAVSADELGVGGSARVGGERRRLVDPTELGRAVREGARARTAPRGEARADEET